MVKAFILILVFALIFTTLYKGLVLIKQREEIYKPLKGFAKVFFLFLLGILSTLGLLIFFS